METILLLAHTEADGSLAKSAREALQRPRRLHKSLAGSNLIVGLVGERRSGGGEFHRRLSGREIFRRHRRGFRPVALRHGCGCGGSVCKAAQATLVVAPATSRWARVLPGVAQRLGGRAERHVTGVGDGGREAPRHPLVLPPAHGRRADARRSGRGSFCIDPGSQAPCQCGAGTATVETVTRESDRRLQAHTVAGIARAERRRANHPARRRIAVGRRRGLDQEAGRRPDARAGGGETDPGFPAN